MPGFVVAEKNEEVRRVVKESLTKEASRLLTICEQLRFMYDSVCQVQDEELRNLMTEQLIDAMNMAKKMDSRLSHYKRLNGDRKGHAGGNLIRLDATAERKELRQARTI